MSNTAQLQINVTSFVANSSATPVAPFCVTDAPTIADGPGGSGLANADGQVGIDPSDSRMIFVNRRNAGNNPVQLVFTIGPGTSFTPLQIVFNQTNGTGDADGSANFKDRNPKDQTISVKNQWTLKGKRNDPAGNSAPAWKYAIQIKNAAGTLGWIDPGIENAEDLFAE